MTSDVERLPFPMAPVQAAGATALAEAGSKEESWRWRVFSIGAMMGLIFGWWFTRTRRVLPLVLAHCLIDIASFVGYAALHGKVSWL